MKRLYFSLDWRKLFMLASMSAMSAIVTPMSEATSRYVDNLGRYDGIDCQTLMTVYKQAYYAVGFKLDHIEKEASFSQLILMFPHPTDPAKPPVGRGVFRFSSPSRKDPSCRVYRPIMGAIGPYDAYELKQYDAFEDRIWAASRRAQAMITRKLGAPKSE